jgi:HlyD family secretion protein
MRYPFIVRRSPSPSRLASLALVSLLATTACDHAPEPDAYGNFEATEVVVSAETSGQIQQFVPVEGMRLARGAIVARIDTTQLALQRRQLVAQRDAASAHDTQAAEQLRALEIQRDIAQRAYERTQRLHDANAATTQQLDQAEREYRTLTAQIDAARAQRQSAKLEVASTEAQVAQIGDRLDKSAVANPEAGTVLATYARAGEVVQTGQPLYKIAPLDTLVLRAYVSEPQLPVVRLGQAASVRVDRGGQLVTLPGRVTWVSSTAEFTPTPVQTRDERADLVYAVKIRVPNQNGALKIGMPGDVSFATDTTR